mgnify:FL=1
MGRRPPRKGFGDFRTHAVRWPCHRAHRRGLHVCNRYKLALGTSSPFAATTSPLTRASPRQIFWLLTIFAGLCFVAILVLLPETYVPYILHMEAKRLRKETGDNRWHSAIELAGGQESLTDILNRSVLKPFRMIAQESMLLVITAYMSFVYAILYLLFVALVSLRCEGGAGRD